MYEQRTLGDTENEATSVHTLKIMNRYKKERQRHLPSVIRNSI